MVGRYRDKLVLAVRCGAVSASVSSVGLACIPPWCGRTMGCYSLETDAADDSGGPTE